MLRIVDSDTHINEPADLWQSRLPAALRDLAPKVLRGSHGGQVWSFEGGKRTASITPLCNVLGVSPVKWELLCQDYGDLPPGAGAPEPRLRDMDIDMVDAHVLYPTYVMAGAQVYSKRDRGLQIACVRAYNDWISEFASYNPDRLYALGTLPVTGVEDALEEARRVRELPGIRAIQMTAFPNGSTQSNPSADEPFWSLMEEMEMPCAIHVGFSEGGEIEAAGEAADERESKDSFGTLTLARLNQERLAVSTIPLMSQFILGGILERHPRLRLGLAEVGIGWIPFFLEQTTFNFMRHRFWTNDHLSMLPKDYFRRQCFATFQEDYYGLRNRDLIGVECLQWSSDYPHSGTDWPNSQNSITNQMRGIPEEEQRLILGGNALRMFGIDEAKLPSRGPGPAASAR